MIALGVVLFPITLKVPFTNKSLWLTFEIAFFLSIFKIAPVEVSASIFTPELVSLVLITIEEFFILIGVFFNFNPLPCSTHSVLFVKLIFPCVNSAVYFLELIGEISTLLFWRFIEFPETPFWVFIFPGFNSVGTSFLTLLGTSGIKWAFSPIK